MAKNIIYGVLILLLVYLIVWSCKLYFYNKKQEKLQRIQELKEKEGKGTDKQEVAHPSAKQAEPVADAPKSEQGGVQKEEHPQTKEASVVLPEGSYWYNIREVQELKADQRHYHSFEQVSQAVEGLLMEMYDCGIVRCDELEEIAYGKDHFQDVDLSFLEEMEQDSREGTTDLLDDVIQVNGLFGNFAENKDSKIVDAAKHLKKDDPGIMDLQGTLSKGVENVLAAVDAEKTQEEKKQEPIYQKEEKSVEEARQARALTATSEIRSQIYTKWNGYVEQLYKEVVVHADDVTQKRIRKALIEYGYNDVDVLLESPE